MNIKHMEYFICLCEEKNYSRAAARLGISQPTLTQTIQKLEKTAGTPLIDRSISPFLLTEAGRIYLATCREIVEISHLSERRLAEVRNGVSGTIRLGVAPYRARSILPYCLKEFSALHPNVRIHLRELVTDNLLEEMENGELDLAITVKQENLDSNFHCIPVSEETVLAAIPKDMLEENAALRAAAEAGGLPAVEPAAFRDMRFILLGEGQQLSRYFDLIFTKNDIPVKTMLRCTEIETSLAFANAGAGAALVLSTGIEYYKERFPNLTYFSLNTPTPNRTVYILSRKKQFLSEPENTLIRLLGEHMHDPRN